MKRPEEEEALALQACKVKDAYSHCGKNKLLRVLTMPQYPELNQAYYVLKNSKAVMDKREIDLAIGAIPFSLHLLWLRSYFGGGEYIRKQRNVFQLHYTYGTTTRLVTIPIIDCVFRRNDFVEL
jgi:hypothetical protein